MHVGRQARTHTHTRTHARTHIHTLFFEIRILAFTKSNHNAQEGVTQMRRRKVNAKIKYVKHHSEMDGQETLEPFLF